jgi:phosphoenolpyruvate carboxykinase (GTP)
LNHWFKMGEKLGKNAPRCFYVNWFRKDKDGKWLWPGFGENSRVLKWMCDRVEGKVGANETPIGLMPKKEDFSFEGLKLSEGAWEKLMEVDTVAFKQTLANAKDYLSKFGDKLPAKMKEQMKALEARLG